MDADFLKISSSYTYKILAFFFIETLPLQHNAALHGCPENLYFGPTPNPCGRKEKQQVPI